MRICYLQGTTVTRVLISLSLTLNVVFALLLIRGQQPQTTRTTVTSAKQPQIDAGPATSIASYHLLLDTKGLNEKERAALMLRYLQERFAQPDALRQRHASLCDAPAEVLARARNEVLLSTGESAIDDPVFGCLFRPLDLEYAELSAHKQLEVYRLLEAYYREVDQPGSYSTRMDSYERLLAKAGEVLSTGEYDEFMLRSSPLGKAIRRMNLELDDGHFRTLVQLVAKDERLSQLVLGNIDESGGVAFQNTKIADLLGSEKFVRFAYSVDPLGAGAPVGKLGKSLAQQVSSDGRTRRVSN